jgi:hypothetical protein
LRTKQMAIDFRDLAAKAKADHEERVKAEQARDAEERDAYNRMGAKAISLLEEQILPFLAQAKVDLAATSVESAIDKDFDLVGFVSKKPSVSFWCKGPRRHDGYQFKTEAIAFSSDGEAITIKPAKVLGQRQSPDRIIKDLAELGPAVRQAIEKVLSIYYEQLEDHRRQGSL